MTTAYLPPAQVQQLFDYFPKSSLVPSHDTASTASSLAAAAGDLKSLSLNNTSSSTTSTNTTNDDKKSYPSLPRELDPSLPASPNNLPAYSLEETHTLVPRSSARKPRPRAPPAPVPELHSGPIEGVFQKVIEGSSECSDDGVPEDAFFVCDLKRVYDQFVRWQKELGPGVKDDLGNEVNVVEPFFAVKCNPDPCVLRLLASLGTGFDCASQAEIESVLTLSVDPNRIIYANPCKASSFIRHAAREHVNLMTFDNSDELVKVSRFHPDAKMVLRILADDSGSLCRFGAKFGADISKARPLLRKAKELGVDVVGVSFHVGSGCTKPELYGDALRRARFVFDVAREEGFEMNLVDVGGGFDDETFESIARELRNELVKNFPKGSGVRVIAEPGRYFVTKAFELATNIIAKRDRLAGEVVRFKGLGTQAEKEEVQEEEPNVMFYINDGVYGAFNCLMFDHQIVTPQILTLSSNFVPSSPSSPPSTTTTTTLEPCQVWGPTCDSIDLVCSSASLPASSLQVGDWLRWEAMGAYTICAASRFNGMKRSEVVYTVDARGEEGVEERIRDLVERAC